MTSIDQLRAEIRAAFAQRNWPQVRQMGLRLVDLDPVDAGVHYVLALAAIELTAPAMALGHLERALQLRPDMVECRINKGRVLIMLGRKREAVELARSLEHSHGHDALIMDTLGVIYAQCDEHRLAEEAFTRSVALNPGNAQAHFNLAMSLLFRGDVVGAETALEASISRDPRQWRAHHALSGLRRQTLQNNHIERLRSLLSTYPGDSRALLFVGCALAKELEDLGRNDESFQWLQRAKTAARKQLRYSPEKDQAIAEAMKRRFATVIDAADGHDTEEPIFVVGMPRSGTTLLERILSGHSRVTSAGELSSFPIALKRALGGREFNLFQADEIAAAAEPDWSEMGRLYLEGTRHVTGNGPHFIDKLPQNFLYLGFIARALPRAKIVCLRRNAMDTCVSNFRQLFAPESPYFDYSYDLLEVGRYYLMFDDLMKHWQSVLPGRVLEVEYESLVADIEPQVRRLLAFCGLPWEPHCIDFHTNMAPVTTASAVQVRQPLNDSSIGRWRRYGAHTDALERLLSEAGVRTT